MEDTNKIKLFKNSDNFTSQETYLKELLEDTDSLVSSEEQQDFAFEANIEMEEQFFPKSESEDISPIVNRYDSFEKKIQSSSHLVSLVQTDPDLRLIHSYEKERRSGITSKEDVFSSTQTDYLNLNGFPEYRDTRGQSNFLKLAKCRTQKEKRQVEPHFRSYSKTEQVSRESIEFMIVNINKIICNQKTSRKLQQRLSSLSQEVIEKIILNLDFPFHMSSKYGNYFCQELFDCCEHKQIMLIMQVLVPNIMNIAKNPFGTHAIQRFIEKLEFNKGQLMFVQALSRKLVHLSKHNWGTHVVQKVIDVFKENNLFSLTESIIKNFVELAFDKHGLCVVKKLIGKIKSKKSKSLIIKQFCISGRHIIEHEYGNYAVQEMLIRWQFEVTDIVANVIKNNFVQLAQQKYASNVVVIVVETASPSYLWKIYRIAFHPETFLSMISVNFANFVLKAICSRLVEIGCTEEAFTFLSEVLERVSGKIKERTKDLLAIVCYQRYQL